MKKRKSTPKQEQKGLKMKQNGAENQDDLIKRTIS